jgi:hypothetical protein
MALDSAGVLYVGTSPDGKVYKVTGPNQFSEFCSPEGKYIWSMVFDAADNLYVGTGGSGIIYKVDKEGNKSAFYTCADNHAVTLLRENNNLLVGTAPGGLVVEITPDGKGFTLADTPLEEVRSLSVDASGMIYAVASASSRESAKATSQAKNKPATVSAGAGPITTITVEAIAGISGKTEEAKTKAANSTEENAAFKSAVYAIAKTGGIEAIYYSDYQMAFDASLQTDGSVLLATGPKGRLVSIDPTRQITVLTDTPEEDMTRILTAGDAIYAAGSNRGKVYRLTNQKAQSGTFVSKTLDAKTVASWGKIFWRGNGVELSTRSGNTEKADVSWSPWSDPYRSPGQQIVSPRARYLQWRATFKRNTSATPPSANDALERLQIAYLQQNLRPQVASIEVLPYGVELQKQSSIALGLPFSMPTTADGRSLNAPRERGKERQPLAPRQALQLGAQSFTWKAVDENEDELEYYLYFKGEGETDWKLLGKKLQDAFYTLNGASIPDGTYRLKVVASDAPSNPYDKFLVGELISDSFVISNTSPQVEITGNKVTGKRIEVQFRARVTVGNIATAEFSIDGGEWNLIFPSDGIADSGLEDYRFVTWELPVGEHLIGIRTSDRDGNSGAAKLIMKIN